MIFQGFSQLTQHLQQCLIHELDPIGGGGGSSYICEEPYCYLAIPVAWIQIFVWGVGFQKFLCQYFFENLLLS